MQSQLTRRKLAPLLRAALLLALLAGCNSATAPTQGESATSKQGAADTPAGASPNATAQATQTSQTSMSDYAPIPLDRLIGTSQLIVTGEVSAVKESTFTLRVERTLAGESAAPEIEVSVPVYFEEGPRPAPYKAGQSLLLFLVRDDGQSRKGWRVMGAGGEGEMPLQDGFVYFHGSNLEGLPFGTHRVHDAERRIQRFEAEPFLDAVKGYRACFAWKPAAAERDAPTRICDAEAAAQYARASDIHKYLSQLTDRRLAGK
ncbi:MAG TPA: hypothetical protein VFX96_16000 [Pyrinomonadaceae bacterium]|nr:hypothetical protein [Pyrinomonadaceae bacterium]